MASIWGELKRRNVVKVAVAYAIVGWLLIEVTSTVFPLVQLPDWTATFVIMLVLIGFPIALILSWAYELTPEGVKKSHEVEATESVTQTTGRKIDFAIIGALLVAVGFLVVNYVLVDPDPGAVAEEVSPVSEPTAEIPLPVVVEEQREVLPNSVAVLLCDNLSPDPDDAYFAASIHEEILNQLVKIRNLTPIARTSVLQYADDPPPISQIAEELRVESVLECSVRYAGSAIMVTAQLIDPETNLHLWSDTYPGDLSDVTAVFAMQADIAMNIANALEVAFSAAEQESMEKQPTTSPAAYELYLRAISMLWAESGRAAAISLLTQAIGLDPDFALAHARAAFSTAGSLIQTFGNPAAEPGERANLEAEARRLAEEALRLDPNLGVALAALAGIDQFYWRWDEAAQAYERALEVAPNHPGVSRSLARLRSAQGNHEDAIELMRRVVDLEPSGASYYILASVLAHSGDPEAALVPAHQAVELTPGNPVPHLWLARIGSALGRDAEVAEHLRIAERLLIDTAAPVGLASLAFTYSRIGRDEDASRVLEQLDAATPDRNFDAGSWVMGYLAQGDADAAFESLQTVVNRVKSSEPDAAYRGLMVVKSNAQRHPVLDEPRFRDLRSQIGTAN